MRLLDDRIAVREIANPELRNGLWVPHEATTFGRDGSNKGKAVTRGEIRHVGPGKKRKDGTRRPPVVSPGELAVFSDTCGRDKQTPEGVLRVMREDDIVATVGPDGSIKCVGDIVVLEPQGSMPYTGPLVVTGWPEDDCWRQGKVVACGPRATVQVGQVAVYHAIDGQQLVSDVASKESKLLAFREEHLLGVME